MYYEYLKGYKDNEYIRGKGYYNIDSNRFSTNKQSDKSLNISELYRFQFKDIDDDLLEDWFGYSLVDRVGYFLSLLRKRGNRFRGRDVYFNVVSLRGILGESTFREVLMVLENEQVLKLTRTKLKGSLYKNKRGYAFSVGERLLKSEYRERLVVNKKLIRLVSKDKDNHKKKLNDECLYLHEIVKRLSFRRTINEILNEFALEEQHDVRVRINELLENDVESYLVDDFGSRLYYPVSGLNASVRKDLLLDNERLIEFDMKTGYFSLLYLLLIGLKFNRYADVISNEMREFAKDRFIGEEWLSLYEDCFKGNQDFYRMVSLRLGKGMGLFKEQRVNIKNALITDLNGRWDVKDDLLEIDRDKLRRGLYVDVLDFVSEWKNNKIFKEFLNGYHKNVSKCLMSMEVNIMKQVWRELREKNVDYLSLHDCVMVKEGDKERLKSILQEVTNKYEVIRFIEK